MTTRSGHDPDVFARVKTSAGSSSDTIAVEGIAADDAVASGNPVQVGGVAIEVDGTDPGAVAAADLGFGRMDLNRRFLVSEVHPNYFSQFTAITIADANTAVVAAVTGMRAHITDIVITTVQAAAIGSFTLTNDAGTAILGPIPLDAANGRVGTFIAHFNTPLVNETQNDQVEMDKTAAEDNWAVYIAGYYAP